MEKNGDVCITSPKDIINLTQATLVSVIGQESDKSPSH